MQVAHNLLRNFYLWMGGPARRAPVALRRSARALDWATLLDVATGKVLRQGSYDPEPLMSKQFPHLDVVASMFLVKNTGPARLIRPTRPGIAWIQPVRSNSP